MKTAFILLALSLPATAQTLTIADTNGATHVTAAIGQDFQNGDFYADFYLNNLVFNGGFAGGVQFRLVELVATATSTSMVSNNNYDQFPSGFANGWSFVVQTGTAKGCAGHITASTPGTYGSAGLSLTFDTSCTGLAANDAVVIMSPASGYSNVGAIGYNVSPNGTGSYSLDTNAAHMPAGFSNLPQATQAFQVCLTSGQYLSFGSSFDTVSGQSNYNFVGQYTQSIMASLLSGSMTMTMVTRRFGGAQYINAVSTLSGSAWTTYSQTSASLNEPTTQAQQVANVIYTVQAVGAGGCADFLNPSLTGPKTNASPFRDQVVNQFAATNADELRFNPISSSQNSWTGCTLENLLQPQAFRQPCVGLIGGGSGSYTGNQGGMTSIPELFELAKTLGWSRAEIPLSPTWSSADFAHYMEYEDGPCTSTYGKIRCDYGDTAPWNTVFTKINHALGNETWNLSFAGSYYGGYPYTAYGPLAQSECGYLKASPYWTSVDRCIATVQGRRGSSGAEPINAQVMAEYGSSVDAIDSSGYFLVNTTPCTSPGGMFSAAVAEAYANTTNGNFGQYRDGMGSLPTVNYESNSGSTSGTCTTAQIAGVPEGEGMGLVNALTPALLQEAFPNQFLDWNFFILGNRSQTYTSTAPGNATSTALYGAYTGMGGAYTNARPMVYAMAQHNALAKLGLGVPVVATGVSTTNFAGSNGIPATANVPTIKALAYKNAAGTLRGLEIFNLDASAAHSFTFVGANAPTGSVTRTLYSSANVNDICETVGSPCNMISTTVLNNPTSDTLPAHSAAFYSYSSTTGGIFVQNPPASGMVTITGTCTVTVPGSILMSH